MRLSAEPPSVKNGFKSSSVATALKQGKQKTLRSDSPFRGERF